MKTLPRCSVFVLLAATATRRSGVFARSAKLDPALDQIVAPGEKAEKVAGGFDKWTEGPAWTRDGRLLFAEIPANNIDQWIPGKGSSVFIHPSGYEGAEPYKGPESGSNGMTLDPKAASRLRVMPGAMCGGSKSVDPKGKITVLADSYDGKKFNSPNDVVYKSDGSLYFTDPPYGLPTRMTMPAKELKFNGVYRIVDAGQHKAGAPPDPSKVQLVIGDIAHPNGIAFSPDEKNLYIAESGKRVWLRYQGTPDGTVGEGTRVLDASLTRRPAPPTAFASIKRAIFTARVPAACGLCRRKASTSARSKFRRSSPTSPGATPMERRSTSPPAPAFIASS